MAEKHVQEEQARTGTSIDLAAGGTELFGVLGAPICFPIVYIPGLIGNNEKQKRNVFLQCRIYLRKAIEKFA